MTFRVKVKMLSCQSQDAETQSVDFLVDAVFVRRGPVWQFIGSGGINNSNDVTLFPASDLIQFSMTSIRGHLGHGVNAISGRILSPWLTDKSFPVGWVEQRETQRLRYC
jgi:hypothetical protein